MMDYVDWLPHSLVHIIPLWTKEWGDWTSKLQQSGLFNRLYPFCSLLLIFDGQKKSWRNAILWFTKDYCEAKNEQFLSSLQPDLLMLSSPIYRCVLCGKFVIKNMLFFFWPHSLVYIYWCKPKNEQNITTTVLAIKNVKFYSARFDDEVPFTVRSDLESRIGVHIRVWVVSTINSANFVVLHQTSHPQSQHWYTFTHIRVWGVLIISGANFVVLHQASHPQSQHWYTVILRLSCDTKWKCYGPYQTRQNVSIYRSCEPWTLQLH